MTARPREGASPLPDAACRRRDPALLRRALHRIALGFGGLALLLLWPPPARATSPHHALWELHGEHSTVYLLGSIHVLRATDYPLAPQILRAYADADALVMEIDLDHDDVATLQSELVAGATLPGDQSLSGLLGPRRYRHAQALARDLGVELSLFDRVAPWFAAEAISQRQLAQLGFDARSGVEMFFLGAARADHKPIDGLETIANQIAVFRSMRPATQAAYLMSSLEEAHDLPKEVDGMVRAWQRGDTAWFAHQLRQEFAGEPALYDEFLLARNRKWLPAIEALLAGDRNTLVIVGIGHLAGHGSVVDLLAHDGFVAVQR